MKRSRLNFSTLKAKRQRQQSWLILLLSVAVLVFIYVEVDSAQLQTQLVAKPSSHTMTVQSSLDPRQTAIIEDTVTQLNIPWLGLFDALEAVAAQHQEIHLLSLVPDVNQREVLLVGEAKSVSAMLAYVDALQAQDVFTYVWPVRQQQLENKQQFSLKMEWSYE